MKTQAIACTLICIALLVVGAVAFAYDCGGVDRATNFGPHRKINEMAVKAWLSNEDKDAKRDKFLKSLNIDPKRLPLLTGIGVTQSGAFDPGLASVVGANVVEGAVNGTFDWWIVEGGFTADEPEIFNSFRHFYDPSQADGVYYLTDHLKELEYTLKVVVFAVTRNPWKTFMASVNPRVDARAWAIEGPQNNGTRPNEYNWNRGLEYMAQAFASKDKDKDKLFVKAWRSLGETMHLMSDMNCPPHVRNDSHPGRAVGQFIGLGNHDANLGVMKNDPYELLAITKVVEAAAKNPLIPNAKAVVDGSKDTMTIFDKVATYTNHRFFTAETISGKFRGVDYHNANGRPDYPFPRLDQLTFDEKTGYFIQDFAGRPVKLAHITWMGEQGWGEPTKRVAISYECVRDQAGVLVPTAVYANSKLIDWYVPRVEVKLEEYDPVTKIIKGQVLHTPYGAHTKPLLYNSGPDDKVELYINELSQAISSYTVTVENGKLQLDLSKVDPRVFANAKKMALEMSIGGLMLRSEDFYFLKILPEEMTAWVNTEYKFYGSANPPPEKVKKLSYRWDFGDGTKTMDYPYEKPLNQPFNIDVKHKFANKGKYEVTLEVADVTSGLWIPLYQGLATVWVMRPCSDEEITEAALAYVKNNWIPGNVPSNVKVTGISPGSVDRKTNRYTSSWDISPSSGRVDIVLTGTQTDDGQESKWSTSVPVWSGVLKYDGPVEASQIVSAAGLNEAY